MDNCCRNPTIDGIAIAGYTVPLRSGLNLIFAVASGGMLACGAFDTAALERFACPAARIKSAHGGPLAALDELLDGTVRDANPAAAARGVVPGMTARAALARLG